MLLVMMEAELDYRDRRASRFAPQQREELRIDMSAVVAHLVQGGTGQQSTLWPRMLRTDGLIIGVEEDAKLRVKRTVTGYRGIEHEGFEEPAGVRQMPLRRAGIIHRLRLAVFGREGCG